ncbi:basic salivary proline-rich protein 2-like [Canis lupus dingo]|uniref:basic salivary proline-rich protein 2-like n=1 Tax=Canis lupus dingo TaxID=286419 RepID=UPI000DC6655A|nr:basic salivary proline-rich protein 2-like [Canis lupus dingo]
MSESSDETIHMEALFELDGVANMERASGQARQIPQNKPQRMKCQAKGTIGGHADPMEPGNLAGILTRNQCLAENSVNPNNYRPYKAGPRHGFREDPGHRGSRPGAVGLCRVRLPRAARPQAGGRPRYYAPQPCSPPEHGGHLPALRAGRSGRGSQGGEARAGTQNPSAPPRPPAPRLTALPALGRELPAGGAAPPRQPAGVASPRLCLPAPRGPLRDFSRIRVPIGRVRTPPPNGSSRRALRHRSPGKSAGLRRGRGGRGRTDESAGGRAGRAPAKA